MENKIIIPFQGVNVIGDIIGDIPTVLFLHGAGTANRLRFQGFRKHLNVAGIDSFAFDFIGHGDTGGDLQKSSLENRTKQVQAVVEYVGLAQPINIIAASMSGYTALKLTEVMEIKSIFFLAPGLYDKKAYTVPFGDGFSDIIRAENSWQNTDAWEILSKYKGKIVIYTAEHDQVVPKDLTDKMYASAVNASYRETYVIKEATHPLGKWLEEHPSDLEVVANHTIEIIRN